MTTRFYDTMVGLAPLHWWRFHNSSLGDEADIGSDPDSDMDAVVGTVTRSTDGPLEVGETTYSAEFSGTSYILRSVSWSSNDFNGLTDGAVVFWFKSSYSGAAQFIIGQHPDNFAFIFYLLASGAMQLVGVNGAASRTLTTDVTGLNDGAWHLFAATCDGATANRLYIDGSEVAYSTSTGGTGLTDHFWLQNAGGTFHVGENPRVPIELPFSGKLSELAFFSYPLSAADVYSLWAATQPPPVVTPGAGGHRYKGRRTFVGF